MNRPELAVWGWDEAWERAWAAATPVGEPARVVAVDRGSLLLQAARGPVRAVDPGPGDDTPTVGDWCAWVPGEPDGPGRVGARLPRGSALVRRAAGRATRSQVLAANVDTAFVVCGLDRDQGLRSLERFLAIVLDGGVAPAVVLNKIDLCEDPADAFQVASQSAPGVPVVAVSALARQGLDALAPWLGAGATVALLGPSGAGKSTLVNALAAGGETDGPIALTRSVRRSDSRGRHTTTRRQLHPLPGGALLLDGPGLRELGAWLEADGLARAFPEVEELARACRFRDCRHDREPGCAVREALLDGELAPDRFHRFLELTAEAEATEARRTIHGRLEAKRHAKQLGKTIRRFYRERER
jgi:ribosome biogenesis GTPase